MDVACNHHGVRILGRSGARELPPTDGMRSMIELRLGDIWTARGHRGKRIQRTIIFISNSPRGERVEYVNDRDECCPCDGHTFRLWVRHKRAKHSVDENFLAWLRYEAQATARADQEG
jgi:hypothetical protein